MDSIIILINVKRLKLELSYRKIGYCRSSYVNGGTVLSKKDLV